MKPTEWIKSADKGSEESDELSKISNELILRFEESAKAKLKLLSKGNQLPDPDKLYKNVKDDIFNGLTGVILLTVSLRSAAIQESFEKMSEVNKLEEIIAISITSIMRFVVMWEQALKKGGKL